jgi:predicted nucleotidyltransferase
MEDKSHDKLGDLKLGSIESEIVDALQKRFGESLLSVVLFGSRPQGRALSHSDFDILVVVSDGMIEKGRSVRRYLEEVMVRHQTPIEAVAVSRDELLFMTQTRFPLVLGVLLGYRVLYDSMGVERILGRLEREVICGGGRKYVRSGLWVVNQP